MFIFSGYFGTLLYTGDFRLHPDHAHLGALPILRRGISRIFLDNTFCHPVFSYPSRETATKELLATVASKWPCLLLVSVYKLGKELLLQTLARHLGTRVLLPPARAAAISALSLPEDLFMPEPCMPADAPSEELWQLGLRGCIWAVAGKQLRPLLQWASSNGIPTVGILSTGWSALNYNSDLSNDAADVGVHDSNDGVYECAYSDHCSFLELVQFLSCLPRAPVTLISPVPRPGTFGYDGIEGVQKLLQFSEAPSISYREKSAAKHTTAKFPHGRLNGRKGGTMALLRRARFPLGMPRSGRRADAHLVRRRRHTITAVLSGGPPRSGGTGNRDFSPFVPPGLRMYRGAH